MLIPSSRSFLLVAACDKRPWLTRGVNSGRAYLSKRYYHPEDLISGCRPDQPPRLEDSEEKSFDLETEKNETEMKVWHKYDYKCCQDGTSVFTTATTWQLPLLRTPEWTGQRVHVSKLQSFIKSLTSLSRSWLQTGASFTLHLHQGGERGGEEGGGGRGTRLNSRHVL